MLNLPTTVPRINFNTLYCLDRLPDLLKDEGKPFKFLGPMFEEFAKTHIHATERDFENPDLVTITHTYNGQPVRGELKNNCVKDAIVEYFADVFKMDVFKPVMYRNYPTDMPSATSMEGISPKDYWVSEFWHSDNEPDHIARLMIYLDDVLEEGDSPFEYYDDPENTVGKFYYVLKSMDDGWKRTRFFDLDDTKKVKVYGPKFSSFIFQPNMIHKANFARNKKRDVISLNLQKLP